METDPLVDVVLAELPEGFSLEYAPQLGRGMIKVTDPALAWTASVREALVDDVEKLVSRWTTDEFSMPRAREFLVREIDRLIEIIAGQLPEGFTIARAPDWGEDMVRVLSPDGSAGGGNSPASIIDAAEDAVSEYTTEQFFIEVLPPG